jgi:D-cysteine desulfhydrase
VALCDPLIERFPSLSALPKADLGVVESPVERAAIADGSDLWIKRDDLDARRLGGNKARALEFLLGGLESRSAVVTVGGIGSTHVLATAVHAASIGVETRAWRWPHEENEVSRRVSQAIEVACASAPVVRHPAAAFAAARWRSMRKGERWIPFGGTTPLGILGHIRGGLELARQVRDGLLPSPGRVFVPLGTGGTAAGLALGFAAGEFPTLVVAVRCGPSLGVDEAWLGWLGTRTRRFLRQHGVAAGDLPAVGRIRVDHSAWSGAYGRPHPGATALAERMRAEAGMTLDATYSAKACYAAWRAAGEAPRGETVLFWHTFDARWMDPSNQEPLGIAR